MYHAHYHVRGSAKSFWTFAAQIRGMSADEAIKQLSFQQRLRAHQIKRLLVEAVDMALTQYNVEFRSDLWIGMI